MRSRFILLTTLFMFMCLFMASAGAESLYGVEILEGTWKGQNIEYLDREILLGLKAGKTQNLFEQELVSSPVQIVRQADRFGFMKLKVNEGEDVFKVIEDLEQLPSVRYAEPNMVDRLLVIPDDSLFHTQWHYHNVGQNPPGGTIDADIDAPEGWDISTGSDTIIVGVLDSGIPIQGGMLSHPDLDDPSRFIIGTDVVNGDSEPKDENGHGTHVSGTIGAETNNGRGVAGVAWNVKIMAIQVFSSTGSGSHEYFRDGCIFGVDNGCKVLNYSGGGSAGDTKEHGVAYADSNGVVLCAAAGNNWQGSCDWPGAYATQYSNVICVSAVDHNDNSSPFSSIGPEVTISAPGGFGSPYDDDDIISTFPNYPCYITTNYGLSEDYGPLAGTSMATPHVAGFAALIMSMNPGLSPDSVRQIMMNTADDLGPAGRDNQYGWGRINVFNALSQMGSIIITHTPLADTKDTLNNYEVVCQIWSITDLLEDSLLLRYNINSIDYETSLISTGFEDEYHGFIPAQAPGTEISYYLYGMNIDYDADTTNTFTFYVIDYGVLLEPEYSSSSAPALDTVVYDLMLKNNGIFTDEFTLDISGNVWNTTLWNALMTSQISSSGVLNPDDSIFLKLQVIIPSSLEGEYDSTVITATSIADNSITTSSEFMTISAGQPWEIPFTDYFATVAFDIAKWESTDGAESNDIGIDEPSAPYSANLNGDPDGGDDLITEAINLRDESNIIVKYFYQQTGGGESPDANDDLIIEWMDVDSDWNEINRHLGSEPDMTVYEEVELQLPTEAMHAGFRLRVRCTATSGSYDDWFVDDIYVGHPSDYAVRMTPSFQSTYSPAGENVEYLVRVINKGYQDDNFELSYTSNWGVTFFDITGAHQITSTGIIPGGDSSDFMVKVEIPIASPLHETNTSTIYATSQGDNNISAYVLMETISAGAPAEIPWYEVFPYDTLFTQRWFTFVGSEVTTEAPNTPSSPYSINLDGGNDTLVTQAIDLSGISGVLLTYYYEMGGYADVPETEDHLYVDYRLENGDWLELNSHEGGTQAMTDFDYVVLELPHDAHYNGLQIRFRSTGSSSGADDWYVDDIRVDYRPDMSASTTELVDTLILGDTSETEFVIENVGQGGLVYDITIVPTLTKAHVLNEIFGSSEVEPASRDYPAEVFNIQVDKGEDFEFSGYPVTFDMGGPDNYGYYWLDSDDPGGPEFEWIDASDGVDIIASLEDDNYSGPYDIGFDFPFYGINCNQIFIGSNGIIGFVEDGMDYRTSRPIPNVGIPNGLLAFLWDDLNPLDADNPGGHVYVKSNANMCIIQFTGYPEYSADPGDIFTGQVILCPDGSIKYQYLIVANGFDKDNCSIGIENMTGDDGLEVVYHADYLKDSLAVEFFKPFDWLVLDKFADEIPGSNADTIHCQFVTDPELDTGTYRADIVINSNDPDTRTFSISAELCVISEKPYLCGDANGDEAVNISDAVLVVNYAFSQGIPPEPLESGDVNCDSNVNVSDAVFIINFTFSSGFDPCDPSGDGIPDC